MDFMEKLNVLIVDDVITIRKVFEKLLRSIGASSIIHADSLETAWNEIIASHEDNNPIDLVFCDWNMPGGDGIDLLKKIRSFNQEDKIRRTKFIMVTGAGDNKLEAMQAGAHNTIHKPLCPDMIKEKLELIYK